MFNSNKVDKKDAAKRVAIGAAVAAAAGYVAGVLTAPKSGKQTRGDIKDAADKGFDKAEREMKQLHKQFDDITNQAKNKAEDLTGAARKEFDELLSRAQSSKEKLQDTAARIKPGKGQDKDLKKAMDDANEALEHLKKYLKK